MTRKLRVAVFRGGPSAEHEVSLKTGASILDTIRKKLGDKYEPLDIFVGKDGVWYVDGRPTEPKDAIKRFDIAWNALHGSYGEDGKIQSVFESHGAPFTGSGSLSSAIGMNKTLTKKILKDAGIKSPYWKELESKDINSDPKGAADSLFSSFILPAVVKPASSGSSVGVAVIKSREQLEAALTEAAKHGHSVLVEEYIPGDEATVGVIDGFRGQETYALPPILIKPKSGFFDYNAKYGGEAEEIVPAPFPLETNRELERLAQAVHSILQLRDYSRADFIINPTRGIYVLEVNTLPGMTPESLMPKALRAVGSDLHELIDHIVQRGLNREAGI